MSTELDALQQALGATHTVIWAYGLIGAVVSDARLSAVHSADQGHRTERGALEDAIRERGGEPVPAEAAYQLEVPQDESSALKLAAELEDAMAQQWRYAAVLARSAELRTLCLQRLQSSAAAALAWRRAIDPHATPSAFPGLA